MRTIRQLWHRLSIVGMTGIILLASSFSLAVAGSPNTIVYQGKVTTASGGAVSDASLNMQFKLFDAVSAGNCKWSNASSTCASSANMSVTLDEGLFTVYLGTDTVATIPDDLFSDNETLYLEVIIAGDTLSPRKQIGSSAYALSSQSFSGANNETIKNATNGNLNFQGVGGTNNRGLTLALDDAAGPRFASDTTFILFDDHVVPGTSNAFTLGTSSAGWDELYLAHPSTGTVIALSAAGSSSTTSGASLVGVYDELAVVCANVQDCLDEIDAARTFDDVYQVSLDASNTIVELDDAVGLTWNLTTTGDMLFQDAGSTFLTFTDTGTITVSALDNDTSFQLIGSGTTTGKGAEISLDALTTGIGLNLLRPNNVGSDFSNATEGFLNVEVQDTASSGNAARFKQAGTGRAGLFESTNTGNSVGVEVIWSGTEVDAGSSAALRVFAPDVDVNNSAGDAVGRRDALVQIETASTSADTFNYIAINEGIGGTTDAKWRVDSSGATHADGAYSSSGADHAEFFYGSDTTLVAGEVVALDAATGEITRSTRSNDPGIIGIVSTNPSFIGNNFTGAERLVTDTRSDYHLVALVGQVPVKVNDEGGPIRVGDFLTSSSMPGMAMRATQPGLVLGQALEPFDGPGEGRVNLFIQRSWNLNGDFLSLTGESLIVDTSLAVSSSPRAVNASGLIDLPAFAIRGTASAQGEPAVSIGMTTLVLDDGSYRLAFSNTQGREVAAIASNGMFSVAGDIAVSGTLRFLSSDGKGEASVYFDREGAGWGSHIRTDADGFQAEGDGFAQMLSSREELAVHDAVVVAQEAEAVEPSLEDSARRFAGVVGDEAGFLSGNLDERVYPIVVSGQARVRVVSEGGDVRRGDPLGASSVSGAVTRQSDPGFVLGWALDDASFADGSETLIRILVQPGWYPGEEALSPETLSVLGRSGSANYAGLTLEGALYLGANDIVNVQSIQGMSDYWAIQDDGSFFTRAHYAVTITGYDDEEVSASTVLSLGEKVTLSGTGQLSNGMAMVEFEAIEPDFNDVISTIVPIKVLVTLTNQANGVFVTQKTNNGFIVQETQGGTSDATFDWYVEAYRKDKEPAKLLKIEIPLPQDEAGEEADEPQPTEVEPDSGATLNIIAEEEPAVSDEPSAIVDDPVDEDEDETATDVSAEAEAAPAPELLPESEPASESKPDPEPEPTSILAEPIDTEAQPMVEVEVLGNSESL